MSESWVSKALELAKSTIQLSTELAKISPSIIQYPTFGSSSKVVSVLEQFQECVRYLNTRRSKGAVINIKSEYDLQDVVFLMLRPWITDLVTENPTDRTASRFGIQDFLSKELNTVVEAKFIRDKKHGRYISKELYDDIETYKNHPNCSEIVFFIYDPNSLIPDSVALRKQIQVGRQYEGKKLNVYCVVKP